MNLTNIILNLKNWPFLPGLVFLFTLIPLESSSNTALPEYQTHSSLYEMLQQHLKQKTDQKLFNPKFHIQKLSKHIRFKTCLKPLELIDKDPQNITGRGSYKISCAQPKWKIFLSATVEGDLPVVVSTQGILKQAVIRKSDVARILVPYKKVRRGAFTNLEKVVGLRAKRAIGPNKIITVRSVQPAYWVFKDRQVNLITNMGNIKIETKGIAMKSGVEQEQVPVKNLSSKKIIRGIVIAPNTVWIP